MSLVSRRLQIRQGAAEGTVPACPMAKSIDLLTEYML